ncbi:MAG: CHAP domain-containing protein [Candidatus Dormibacteria bacterium]
MPRAGLGLGLAGCLLPATVTLSLVGLISAGAISAAWPALGGLLPRPGGFVLQPGKTLSLGAVTLPTWIPPCSPEPAPVAVDPSACAGAAGTDPADYQGFATGQCTWYVATRRRVAWHTAQGSLGGNAGQWLALAEQAGYSVGPVPELGSIAVYADARDGHVAWVVGVDQSGDYTVAEANWVFFGPRPPYVDVRGVAAGTTGSSADRLEGFIYGPPTASSGGPSLS